MAGVGEGAVGALASCCLACCCHQFDKYIVQADKNVSDLKVVVDKLAGFITDIKKKVSLNQLGNSAKVAENWLQRSDAVSSASEKLSQKIEAMCCRRLNFWARYIIGKRAFREIKKANRLIEEAGKLVASTAVLPQQGGGVVVVQEKQIETKVVGMDPYLKTALQYIDGTKVGVVGICGMGGVGKTTLLRKIHREFLPAMARSKDFNNIIWAVVSKKSFVDEGEIAGGVVGRELGFCLDLQSDIGRELGLHLDREPDTITRESLELRALPIYEYLNGRSFLLLLDDLWKPFDLRLIGIPDPTRNSGGSSSHSHKQKVVLTSRSDKVCGSMHAANGLINVKCLEENDAWDLFEFNATKQTIASHQDIENLARGVMKECQGLPLALNTIGKALSTKVGDPRLWQAALDKLRQAEYVNIPGMENENAAMLYRLKLSYDYLPSQENMDCFLSCCLWPEDYSIEIAKLIECWFGLGIIPESYGVDACRVIISNLKQVHLLEPGDDDSTEVKMHDTIRIMSLWISSGCGKTKNKWLVKAGVRIQTAQTVSGFWHHEDSASMERLSLMNNIIEALPSEQISECSKLKVLMLQHNKPLRAVPGSFLQCAPALTYLDLSDTRIHELPGEVKLLHGLEYLNLSESHIRKLPEELSSLTELRYIYLSCTNYLTTVPYGIISNLRKLQALDVYQSRYTSWDEARVAVGNATPQSVGENGNCSCLEELKARETSLKRLGITLDKAAALQNLARSELVWIKRLCFKKLSKPTLHLLPSSVAELLGSFDMLKSLEEFMLSTSAQLKEITIDGGNDGSKQTDYCLPALHKLKLVGLSVLEQIRFHGISANDFLPSLRTVQIFHCFAIKNVNWLLRLPQLSHLDIQFCNAIETLIIDDDTGMEHPINDIEAEQTMAPVFPVLKTLTIHSLGSLTSLGSDESVNFRALEILEITQCKNLTRLHIHPQGNLREIRCGEKWWHDLKWDDNSIQQEALLPYFRASNELKRNAS